MLLHSRVFRSNPIDADLHQSVARLRSFALKNSRTVEFWTMQNEFLKEHRTVEELEATVTQLQAAFKAQAAQIHKVSDQLKTQAVVAGVVGTFGPVTVTLAIPASRG